MAIIDDPKNRLWRVGSGDSSNEIYALVYNDVTKPTRDDVLIGTMETSAIAEDVVDIHNLVLRKFGRHYPRVLRAA